MPFANPERQREYKREYRLRNLDKINAYLREYRRKKYATDPEYRTKVDAATAATPNEVSRARQRVGAAIKRGELVRPEICEECGRESYIEAAHADYSRPLEVRWLCRRCHRKWDSPGNGKVRTSSVGGV